MLLSHPLRKTPIPLRLALIIALATPMLASAAEPAPGTITRLVGRVRPGDVITLAPGVYRREQIVFHTSGEPERPIILRARTPGTVVIRGSAVVSQWRRLSPDSPIYQAKWRRYFEPVATEADTGIADARSLPRNQLFVDGRQLQEVLTPQLEPGQFHIDPIRATAMVRLPNDADPNAHQIEISDTEDPLLSTNGQSHLRIEGLVFEHGANRPQGDALVQIDGGSDCVVRNTTVRHAAGAGLSVRGQRHLIEGCTLEHNGQLGLHSTLATDCRVIDTELAYNNNLPWRRFDPAWEAGGCKITESHDFELLRVRSHHNHGSGIWFDIDNHGARILDCESFENGVGIHYEISYTAVIRGNRCHHNRLQGQDKNSPAGQGIYISSSAGCTVTQNICTDNATRGIEVWGPVRDDGVGREIAAVSNRVIENVIANNQRENPSATDFVLGYGAHADLALPPLRNDVLPAPAPNVSDRNRFYRDDDRPFFWLPDGERAADLPEWQRVSGQDAHSTWAPPPPDAAPDAP